MRHKFLYSFIVFVVVIFSLFIGLFVRKFLFLENLTKIFKLNSIINENLSLRKENLDLSQRLSGVNLCDDFNKENLIQAKVFSLYPFNTKSRIFIL